jgi:hypothetical protein
MEPVLNSSKGGSPFLSFQRNTPDAMIPSPELVEVRPFDLQALDLQ